MSLRRLSRGARLLLAVAAGGAVFGIASVVQADIPDAGVIHGCYGKPGTQYKGQLRVRDASQGEQCRFYENQLDWNANGVTGATGPTGPTGATGPTDAYTAFVGFFTAVNAGNSATIASVTVPSGSYTLAGTIGAEVNPSTPGPNDQAIGECDYSIGSGGTVSVFNQVQADWFLSEFEIGDTFEQDVPLSGDVTVTSATATINLICSNDQRSSAQASFNGSLVATRIGTLH